MAVKVGGLQWRVFLWVLTVALFGYSTLAPGRQHAAACGPAHDGLTSPSVPFRDGGADEESGEPPAPAQDIQCGQSAVGVIKKEDSRGLALEVVNSCRKKPRGGLFGFAPELGGLNVRCAIYRKTVRFDRSADGSKNYNVIGNVPDRICCEDMNEKKRVITGLVQVQQSCR